MTRLGKCQATTADGRECPTSAVKGTRPPRCPLHGTNALRYQRRGAIKAHMQRAFGDDFGVVTLETTDECLDLLARLTDKALKDPHADLKRIDSARGLIKTASDLHATRAQEAIAEALGKIEHGDAYVLLERLRAGVATGRSRPLPGARVLPMSPPPDGAA